MEIRQPLSKRLVNVAEQLAKVAASYDTDTFMTYDQNGNLVQMRVALSYGISLVTNSSGTVRVSVAYDNDGMTAAGVRDMADLLTGAANVTRAINTGKPPLDET